MKFALIQDGTVVNIIDADEAFVTTLADIDAAVPSDEAGIGWLWDGAALHPPAPPDPGPTPPDPAQWLIDVGPFFDRFGAAKLQVLASADATVRALVTDLQVRKWIDLQRPDVAAGIDLLTTKGVGVTAALKADILTTPVAPAENLALRKTYFS